MFLSLFSGAMLLTVPYSVKGSPSCLAKVLFRRHFTTILQVTPTLVHRFSTDDIRHGLLGHESHVRVLAFGGEKCPDYNYLASVKAPGVCMLITDIIIVIDMVLYRWQISCMHVSHLVNVYSRVS